MWNYQENKANFSIISCMVGLERTVPVCVRVCKERESVCVCVQVSSEWWACGMLIVCFINVQWCSKLTNKSCMSSQQKNKNKKLDKPSTESCIWEQATLVFDVRFEDVLPDKLA